MPDDIDPVIPYDAVDLSDAPVIHNDVDAMIPGADAPISDGDQETAGSNAPIIPGVDAQMIPYDAGPGRGWHVDTLLGSLITLFSSFEILNGYVSVRAKSTHVAGGSALDAPCTRVLSKVSTMLGLGFVLAIL